jgi:hypothetical protein
MPRKEIDYSKTVMYKIVPKDLNNDFVYVGSTTEFTKRKSSHKFNCLKEKSNRHNLKIYQTIRENGGWEEFQMIKIENYPCEDHNESLARERYWLEHFNANLNVVKPCRTKKEYYNDNKKNWDVYNQRRDKVKVAEYKKMYAQENKVKIADYKKQYYEKNKNKISEQSKPKVTCKCGCEVSKVALKRHFKTLKHKNWLLKQNSNSKYSSDDKSSDSESDSSDSESSSDSDFSSSEE